MVPKLETLSANALSIERKIERGDRHSKLKMSYT